MSIKIPENLRYLSELYVKDSPEAVLLTEYPSSNSEDTFLQNKTEFIIHDPFPPPPRSLLKTLGPHHLMYGWGKYVSVTSEVRPPDALLEHWQRTFGTDGTPNWVEFNPNGQFITLFPLQSLDATQQVIDPAVNYELHSKEVIEKISCRQADVFESVQYPCMVKLSHGYAGLGNYLLRSSSDETAMKSEQKKHWPSAKLVINSVIENVVGDYGVQFYLHRDGTVVWIGLTEQHFNDANKWCGGSYSMRLQTKLLEPFAPIVSETAAYLNSQGYHGLVGIDILRDDSGECFLVDVNPRLTGITPFLMASRIFAKQEGLTEGVYLASFRFDGSLQRLIETAESVPDCRVMVLSAFEDSAQEKPVTICHLSISSQSQSRNKEILESIKTGSSLG